MSGLRPHWPPRGGREDEAWAMGLAIAAALLALVYAVLTFR